MICDSGGHYRVWYPTYVFRRPITYAITTMRIKTARAAPTMIGIKRLVSSTEHSWAASREKIHNKAAISHQHRNQTFSHKQAWQTWLQWDIHAQSQFEVVGFFFFKSFKQVFIKGWILPVLNWSFMTPNGWTWSSNVFKIRFSVMLKLCSFLHMYELPSDASHRDKLELPSLKDTPVTKVRFARKSLQSKSLEENAPIITHWSLLTTSSQHSQGQSTQEEFACLLQEIIKVNKIWVDQWDINVLESVRSGWQALSPKG